MASAISESEERGATVVITHRIRGGEHAAYEAWLEEISPHCKASPGHLDWHIVRPIAGLTQTYTIIIRFDTVAHVRQWMDSPIRARLIDKVKPLLLSTDDFVVSSGLDFWFTPSNAKAALPVRWKQFLLTWSAIYPLVTGVSLLLQPYLSLLDGANNLFLRTFIVTGVVVFFMVYIVMPRYTKLVSRWLFS